MASYVLTANRVLDGSVVFLGDRNTWSPSLAGARVLVSDTDRDAALEWAKAQEHEIADPYPADVETTKAGPVPTSARERIRAEGARVVLERLGYGAIVTAKKPTAP